MSIVPSLADGNLPKLRLAAALSCYSCSHVAPFASKTLDNVF